jgi:hypothetical protein
LLVREYQYLTLGDGDIVTRLELNSSKTDEDTGADS